MLVLACNDADFNATTGECAAPFYTQYSASVWTGWTLADFGAFAAAVMTAVAIAYVIRWLHTLANQQ